MRLLLDLALIAFDLVRVVVLVICIVPILNVVCFILLMRWLD